VQHTPRASRAPWGRKLSWSGVITVAVALLFLVPSAASAKSTVTLKAPYAGSVYSGDQGTFNVCPGTTSWALTPDFNLTNGRAYVVAQSSQPACTAGSAGTYATAYTELVSASFSMSTGHHSLKATWSASYSIHLVATPGPSPQTAYAEGDLYTFAYVYDLTAGTTVFASYSTNLAHSVSSGSLVKSYHTAALSDFVNGTFVKSHSYEVVVLLEISTDSVVSAGTSTASAEVNAGTTGEKGTLLSISIS
jgi:hypothetical protein